MQLESFQLCAFTVCGQAFLWHQIRCMIAVLILIGLGLEKPEVGPNSSGASLSLSFSLSTCLSK